LPPLTPHTPQRHNAYIYAVAHAHDVDCRDVIQDGRTFVDIDAGFEVAPGDASDIEVANAHAWGSWLLLFSGGAGAFTAQRIACDVPEYPSSKGTSCHVLNWIPAAQSHVKTGRKCKPNHFLRDGARVAAEYDNHDVLLRRRA
jgi:hypothetical protein